jgi:hypothetical protein
MNNQDSLLLFLVTDNVGGNFVSLPWQHQWDLKQWLQPIQQLH